MTDTFSVTPGGNMVITKSGRTVFTTAGKLVMGLPANAISIDPTATYPDFNKSYCSNWTFQTTYEGASGVSGFPLKFQCNNRNDVWLTALPQEWSLKTTLLTGIPKGANLFMGNVRVNRPTAPTHPWEGKTISCKQPLNTWLPLNGGSSLLLEHDIGFSRAVSFYTEAVLSGGVEVSRNFVMYQQQSVGPVPGGYNVQYGDTSTSVPTSIGQQWQGGDWFADPRGAGTLLYTSSVTDDGIWHIFDDRVENAIAGSSAPVNTSLEGTLATQPSDPTNFGSAYSIEIVGQFCVSK